MTVDPARAAGQRRASRDDVLLLQQGLRRQFRADPERYLSGRRDPMPHGAAAQVSDDRRPEEAGAPGPQPPDPSPPALPLNTPAPCIPRSSATGQARVRNAAWRSSPIGARAVGCAEPRARRHDAPILRSASSSARRCFCCRDGRHGDRWGACRTASAWRGSNVLQMMLATPVVLWCGAPFFERMWESFVHRSPNMFTLIGLGVGAAYVYSAVATLAPGVFPAGFRMHDARRDLLRHDRRHHRARAARPGDGAARAASDRRGDSRAARPGADDRARVSGRARGGRAARRRPGRRRPARAARREGAGRRRRGRRRRRRSTNRWSAANRFRSSGGRAIA